MDTKTETEQPLNMALGKTIFFTFLKSALYTISMAFLVVAVLVAIAPKKAIKLFDAINANSASLACYEMVYKYSGKNSDVYNLIEKSLQLKDYSKAEKYIPELRAKDDYNDFATKVNAAAISNSETKYVAYVGDLDGYLVGQLVRAKYLLGKGTSAKDVAISDLENEDVFSFGLSTYVSMVVGDNNLSDQVIKTELSGLLSVSIEGKGTVLDLINDRIDSLKRLELGSLNAKVNDILRNYTLIKIYNTLYNIYNISGEEELAGNASEQVETLRARYEELIG